VGILDVWASKSVPSPEELNVSPTTDVFVKAVVNNKFKPGQMLQTLKPHVSLRPSMP